MPEVAMTPKRAQSRYVRDFWIAMIAYVVLIFATPLLLGQPAVSGWLVWLVSILPALPLLRIIQVMGRFLGETDEYVRALQTRRLLAGLGATLAVCTVWGFAETFAAAPHLDLYLVFPLFCILFGASCLFIRRAQ